MSVAHTVPEPAESFGGIERIWLISGVMVMLAMIASAMLIASWTDADLSDAARTRTIRALTVDLLEEVTLAESSQRGYLLTGQDSYLEPYRGSAKRVPELMSELAKLLPDDPDRIRSFPLILAKMVELDRTIQLEKSGHRDAALAAVQSGQGKRAMDAIMGVLDPMVIRQRVAYAIDLARTGSRARLTVAVDAVAFLVLACLVLFVARKAARGFRDLHQAQSALRAANAALLAGSDRLEQAVAERTADLTEANAEIQRFAYIVSHDLRAPLLNIVGFTAELEVATSRLNDFVGANLSNAPREVREASQEDLPEAIRFIQASTAKMDRLISAILRLSREGRRVLAPETLDMGVLISGVVDSVRHQADAAGAEIAIDTLPAVVSDRIALEQIFSNLIENALKYGQQGRPVRIRVSGTQRGAETTFTIEDNGRGILPRDQERVFELFRRAGLQDQPGEGIGLAHVKALLRRLGGSIGCRSTIGQGSSFIVTLPSAYDCKTFVSGAGCEGAGDRTGEGR